jgi:O-antigen/teichoic acid export membrane protein
VYGLTRVKSWRATAERGVEMLRDSWPLIFSGIVIMIYMRIDQVMLGEMVGPEEVGIYSAAVRLSEVWFFIPMSVCASWSPSIIEAKKLSSSLFVEKLQELYNAMAFLAYAVAVPATLVAGPVVRLVFGHGYERAAPMLVVLLWSGIFTNLGIARSTFLTTMNWTRTHLLTVALGGIANVLLNLYLIPRWGGLGAAIASLVAYWLAAHGACFLYPPLRPTGRMLTKAMLFPKAW